MKTQINCFSWLFVCMAIVAARETSYVSSIGSYPADLSTLSMAVHEDIIVLSTSQSDWFQVRRRDPDGFYPLRKEFHMDGTFPITNGKWIGAVSQDQILTIGILSDDQIENPITLDYWVRAAKLFDDDTLVILEGRSHSMLTLMYNTSTNTWYEIQRTNVSSELHPLSNTIPGPDPTLCFQENYFVGFNGSREGDNHDIMILERQADLSWAAVVQTSMNDKLPYGYWTGFATFNGNDTIAITLVATEQPDDSQGEMSILMKDHVTGNWSLIQRMIPSGLGYRPLGGIYLPQFINATSLIITAPLENADPTNGITRGGMATILSWNSTQWVPTKDIVTNDNSLLGIGLARNRNDIIILGANLEAVTGEIYSVPYCFNDPLNVTCLTLHLADCTSLPGYQSWYKIHPQCGYVKAQFDGIGFVNDHITAQYSFSKYGQNFTCTAAVYCPIASTTNPPTIQSSPNSPLSTAVSPTIEISPASGGPVHVAVPLTSSPKAITDPGRTSPESNSVSFADRVSVSAAICILALVFAL